MRVVLDSPYRSLTEPLLEYIEQLQKEEPWVHVTVILLEFVPLIADASSALTAPRERTHHGFNKGKSGRSENV